jgi:Cu-processing system permease protein
MIDIMRNKVVLAYTFLSLTISLSVFNIESDSTKGLLSLLNIVLLIVPLVCIVFSTIYIYNSTEFIELLVSHPVKRKSIWFSLFEGLSLSLVLAFLIGIGIPVIFYQPNATGCMLIAMGILLTIIFVGIAMLASLIARDKAKGIGLSILLWLYFSLIFDALLLFLLFQFQDYPLEKVMIGFSFFNPIDIGRIMILLKMDTAALMGYTGAVFKEFFGSSTGIIITLFILILWIVVPFLFSLKKFNRKDL